jgi:Zn-dependent oligopeptidase
MMRGRLSSTALIRWKLVRSSSRPCAAFPSSLDLSSLTIHPVYKINPDYDRTTSQRLFSSLARKALEMIRTGSFHPPNPLLPTSDSDTPVLPDFTHVQPYHLVEAARQVNDNYIRDFIALEQSLQNDATQVSAEWLLNELKRLQEPVAYIQNVAALYHSLFQIPTWENASNNVANILYSKPHEYSRVIMKVFGRWDQEGSLSIRHYLNMYRNAGVQHEQEDSLRSIHDKLEEVEARFLKQHASAYEKRSTTREQLEDMYAMVATKTQVAELLGSNNYAEYVLESERRMATSPNEISLLHEKVNQHFSSEFAGDVDYEDTREYLTLDGVLMGMFGLTRALFGIEIQESESPCGWTNDVRLFHAVDETTKEHLASFYLDPYFRGTKARYCFLSPLGRKSMFISAPIAPPSWNDMPTPLKFDDALALFHEFGHALQFILAKESPVPVDRMPQDVSEMMPLVRFLADSSLCRWCTSQPTNRKSLL